MVGRSVRSEVVIINTEYVAGRDKEEEEEEEEDEEDEDEEEEAVFD